uniref:hypothetical protein n=1 Tax=Photobacterium lucens TaxID=2562949 RepID=UPI001CA3B333
MTYYKNTNMPLLIFEFILTLFAFSASIYLIGMVFTSYYVKLSIINITISLLLSLTTGGVFGYLLF